ncbi:MAG: hypothetical protein WCK36_05045, partial [Candidatus Firestonebacteria bacterium]
MRLKIKKYFNRAFLVLISGLLFSQVVRAQDLLKPVNGLYNIKLISEAEPDMSSLEAIISAIIKPEMTDEQKCLTVMKFVSEHRFWAPSLRTPGCGFDEGGTDLVLLMNSTIPTICQQDAALCSVLWKQMGYDVRYWQLKGHTTSEVKWGGKWRNLDATFPEVSRGQDNNITGVVEGNKRYKPKISYIEDFDDFVAGHSMVLGLRKGEKFTRYWGPLSKGHDYWIPSFNNKMPGDNDGQKRSLATIIQKKPYTFDTQGCGYGNGLWTFVPEFTGPDWKTLAEYVENLTAPVSKDGYLELTNPAKKGVIIYKVYTPYIVDSARIKGSFLKEKEAKLAVFISKNNGMNWEPVWDSGQVQEEKGDFNLGLRAEVRQKLCYFVKFEMDGPGAGLKDLSLETVVQVNPLSLPALKSGENNIRFEAGEQT